MYRRVERVPFLGNVKGVWLFLRYPNALTPFLLAPISIGHSGSLTLRYYCSTFVFAQPVY